MSTLHVDSEGQARDLHELVPSVSITHLLQQREAALERVKQAFALLAEADRIARSARLGFPYIVACKTYRGDGQDVGGEFGDTAAALEACRLSIDAGAWRFLMDESGMRSLMSARKRYEFDENVRKHQIPELTREAICATFGALHDSRGEMFDQGIIEVFKRLSWDYKTNLPQKFGKRIIVKYLCYTYGINHNSVEQLDDLMRVFHVLDGKPEGDHRQGSYAKLSDAFRENSGYPKVFENEYLSIRLFGNGNGHILFKRLDLVDAMNGVLAKHFPNALPAAR
jgi:hypothetical protein